MKGRKKKVKERMDRDRGGMKGRNERMIKGRKEGSNKVRVRIGKQRSSRTITEK